MKTLNLEVTVYGSDDTIDFARALVALSPERETKIKEFQLLAQQAAQLSQTFASVDFRDPDISRMDSSGFESDATAIDIQLKVSEDHFWWSGNFKYSDSVFETEKVKVSDLATIPDDEKAPLLPVDCMQSFNDTTASGMLNPANGLIVDIDENFSDFDTIVLPDGENIDVTQFEGRYFVLPEFLGHVQSLTEDAFAGSNLGM